MVEVAREDLEEDPVVDLKDDQEVVRVVDLVVDLVAGQVVDLVVDPHGRDLTTAKTEKELQVNFPQFVLCPFDARSKVDSRSSTEIASNEYLPAKNEFSSSFTDIFLYSKTRSKE